MSQALLVSDFPLAYTKDTIAPKLEDRGFNLVDIIPSKACINRDISKLGLEAIIVLYELTDTPEGANAFQRIKQKAKDHDMRFWSISHKASRWPAEMIGTAPKKEVMQQQKSQNRSHTVLTEHLEEFLQAYMDLHAQGFRHSEMVERLKQFWQGGTLKNGHQLGKYLSRVVASDRCPDYFKHWWEENKHRQVSPTLKIDERNEDEEIVSEATNDDAELMSLYLQENNELREKLAAEQQAKEKLAKHSSERIEELLKEIEGLKRQLLNWDNVIKTREDELAELRAENKSLTLRAQQMETEISAKSSSSAGDQYRQAVKILKEAIELGFMDYADAFNKLASYSPK